VRATAVEFAIAGPSRSAVASSSIRRCVTAKKERFGVKSDRCEAFLKNAGNAYSSEKTEFGRITAFSERGCAYACLNYEDDPDLLHLRCQSNAPEPFPDAKRLADTLLGLEIEYPVVKLRALSDGSAVGFEVSTEQYEPDSNAVEWVFWRTIDLMRKVADECYRRLQESPVKPPGGQGEAWIAHIEDALRNGCPDPSESASITARLRASLALVVLTDQSTGSAFCVRATDEASFYVTNAHVIEGATEVTVYRQVPMYEKMVGSVVAKGEVEDVDLAIVSVPTGNVPSVTIHPTAVRVDSPVALAGYAQVQIWAAETLGELTPSIHLGTVTAVNKSGSTILHDALSRPGNSGGPLFDPTTGNVLGVEKGGWEGEEEAMAIGAKMLSAFLSENADAFSVEVAKPPVVTRAVHRKKPRVSETSPTAALRDVRL
jgi:S1-C subfamily serine protease